MFRALIYLPKMSDKGYLNDVTKEPAAVKLYVQKVLISDAFDDLLPGYLSFVKGIVDSSSLPLNVSRETL